MDRFLSSKHAGNFAIAREAVQRVWGRGFDVAWQDAPVSADARDRTRGHEFSVSALLALTDIPPEHVPSHLRDLWRDALSAMRSAIACSKCITLTTLHSEQQLLRLEEDKLLPIVTLLRDAATETGLGAVDTIVLDLVSQRDPCAHCCMLLAGSTAIDTSSSLFGRIKSLLIRLDVSLAPTVRSHVRASGVEQLQDIPQHPASRRYLARDLADWATHNEATSLTIRTQGYIPSLGHTDAPPAVHPGVAEPAGAPAAEPGP